MHLNTALEHRYCDISRVPDLLNIDMDSSSITFGASVTLSKVIYSLEELISKGGMYTSRGSGPYSAFPSFVRHLKLVAHPQVRDVSSWTGNLMLAKAHPNFPSDVVIVLIAANALLTLMNSKGEKVSTDVLTFLRTPLEKTQIVYVHSSVSFEREARDSHFY